MTSIGGKDNEYDENAIMSLSMSMVKLYKPSIDKASLEEMSRGTDF